MIDMATSRVAVPRRLHRDADALHCHHAMARTVLDRGRKYVLAIKANRGPLFKAVVGQFARSGKRTPRLFRPTPGQSACYMQQY
jgi:hypothetical protein